MNLRFVSVAVSMLNETLSTWLIELTASKHSFSFQETYLDLFLIHRTRLNLISLLFEMLGVFYYKSGREH